MRILIATHHLQDITGSEVVALEWATHCRARGHDVEVYASWAGPPMQQLFHERVGVTIATDPSEIFPLQFDLSYLQHQVAGLFAYDETPADRTHTTIVFGRMSRWSFLESGGWAHDHALGDQTMANSELTATSLHESGVSHPVTVFYNAAPARFAAPPRALPEAPRKVLVVSNHWDQSLLDAVVMLREHAEVVHLGQSGSEIRLVTPEDVQAADVVVSIGKTVQSALLAHTPVYVYDHFGGPGYLNERNYEAAAHYSFTGRCCERLLSAESLHADIVARYREGRDFAAQENHDLLRRFRLEPYFDSLLNRPASSNVERRRRIQRDSGALKRERLMAEHVRASHRRERFLRTVLES